MIRRNSGWCVNALWWLVLLACMLCGSAVTEAAQPWNKDPKQWAGRDIDRILFDSPWALVASAGHQHKLSPEDIPQGKLPGAPESGLGGQRPYTGAGWDGGVGKMPRGSPATVPVTIRWDSARPVREALGRLPAPERAGSEAYSETQLRRDYVITVIGLIPAGRYRSAGQLATTDQSSHSEESGSRIDPLDPEPLLEELMGASELLRRNGQPIRPEDAKLDAATGTVHLFFPRTHALTGEDKEVTFESQFGSMTVERRFRLKEMMYLGRLEL